MGFAVSQLTSMTIIEQKANLESRIMRITNQLMDLARKSADITNKQQVEAQNYINQDDDPVAAIEYVNSDAFQSKYQAQLAQIHVKEQQLDVEKQQAETHRKQHQRRIHLRSIIRNNRFSGKTGQFQNTRSLLSQKAHRDSAELKQRLIRRKK